jgi:hypothetical protein
MLLMNFERKSKDRLDKIMGKFTDDFLCIRANSNFRNDIELFLDSLNREYPTVFSFQTSSWRIHCGRKFREISTNAYLGSVRITYWCDDGFEDINYQEIHNINEIELTVTIVLHEKVQPKIHFNLTRN